MSVNKNINTTSPQSFPEGMNAQVQPQLEYLTEGTTELSNDEFYNLEQSYVQNDSEDMRSNVHDVFNVSNDQQDPSNLKKIILFAFIVGAAKKSSEAEVKSAESETINPLLNFVRVILSSFVSGNQEVRTTPETVLKGVPSQRPNYELTAWYEKGENSEYLGSAKPVNGFASPSLQGDLYQSSKIPGLNVFAGDQNEIPKALGLIKRIEKLYDRDPDFKAALNMKIKSSGAINFTIGNFSKKILGQAGIGSNQIMISSAYFESSGAVRSGQYQSSIEGRGSVSASDRLNETIAHELLHTHGHTHNGVSDELTHDRATASLLDGYDDTGDSWLFEGVVPDNGAISRDEDGVFRPCNCLQ